MFNLVLLYPVLLFYKFLLYLVKSLNSCLWLIWLCSGVSCSDPDLLFWFWWKIVSAIGEKTKNIHKSKFVVRHLRMTETSKKITRIFFFLRLQPKYSTYDIKTYFIFVFILSSRNKVTWVLASVSSWTKVCFRVSSACFRVLHLGLVHSHHSKHGH